MGGQIPGLGPHGPQAGKPPKPSWASGACQNPLEPVSVRVDPGLPPWPSSQALWPIPSGLGVLGVKADLGRGVGMQAEWNHWAWGMPMQAGLSLGAQGSSGT